jgi:tetratricopeptide (TPR) repeat protein
MKQNCNYAANMTVRKIFLTWARPIFTYMLVLLMTGIGFSKKITVEGVGYDEKSALQNALRHAVETGVAKHLKEKKLKENKDKVKNKILNQTQGYVSNHFIIETKKEFGLVKIKVAAEIKMGKLEEDLLAQKLLYEIKNKPRIMILLDERFDGKEMFEKTATHKFEEYLLEKGFKIIEPEQFKKVQGIERAKGMNDANLASLAFRHGADLIIRGGISAGKPTPKTIYGKQFYTVPVQLNAHIVKADNAEIIASKTKRIKKNSQEEFSAAQFSLEVGGTALAKNLMKELTKYWRSEAYNQATVQLVVTGLGDRAIFKTQQLLEEVDFIKDVQLRYMEKKNSLFDIQMKGSIQDLRELFTKAKNLNLSVTSVTSNRIGVKAGKKRGKINFEIEDGPGLDIEAFSIKEIFPSRVRYYEKNSLAMVKLKCLSDSPIKNIQVSVNIPQIMDLPGETTYKILSPGEETEVKLNLILNSDKVLKFTETKSVSGQVSLTYFSNGREQTRKLTTPVQIYDRNTMDWATPYSLAAFVTYREASIHNFARQAVVAAGKKEGINTPMTHGIAIFQALHELGIKYVKDPAGEPGNRVLDRVQYPLETMISLSGDCDDTSVLYAALLTAVGIDVAIVSYPDHVLVMFDTGVFVKNRFSLGADASRMISHKGTLWIPVETTLINKAFFESWTTAAEEFNQAVSDGQRVSVIELKEAWKSYGALSMSNPDKVWKIDSLMKAVAQELTKVKTDIDVSWERSIKAIEESGSKSPEDQNKLGILYARSGKYSQATTIFRKLMNKTKNPQTMSNYACAEILNGDENKALTMLNKAFKKEKLPGVAINRALSYYLKSQNSDGMDQFVAALKDAIEVLPEGTNVDQYLGFSLEGQEETRAAGEHEKAQKQKLDRRRLKELIRQRVLSRDIKKSDKTKKEGKVQMMHFGGVRGADPEQVAQIVDLLYWFEL